MVDNGFRLKDNEAASCLNDSVEMALFQWKIESINQVEST